MSTATASSTRLVTLLDANRMLPLVRRIVEDIVAVHQSMTEREARLRRCTSRGAGLSPGVTPMHREELEAFEETIDEQRGILAHYINELTDLGVLLKAIDVGGVSFPAVYRGRLVFLSWKLGEESIGHWHELDAGFIGRQPIDALLPEIAEGPPLSSP